MNKKAKRRALQSALSLRAAEEDVMVLEGLSIEEPKTKTMVEALTALGLGKERTLLVLGTKDENALLSGRNIPWLDMTLADNLTTYRVLRAGKLVMTVEALDRLDERSW
jgi:large subunit ribosomal protein L4